MPLLVPVRVVGAKQLPHETAGLLALLIREFDPPLDSDKGDEAARNDDGALARLKRHGDARAIAVALAAKVLAVQDDMAAQPNRARTYTAVGALRDRLLIETNH